MSVRISLSILILGYSQLTPERTLVVVSPQDGVTKASPVEMSRNIRLTGHVLTHNEWDERFHGKDMTLVLRAPPSRDTLIRIATAENIDAACGTLTIHKNLEKNEPVQLDGGVLEFAPVAADLSVDEQSFDRLFATLRDAQHQRLEAGFDIQGISLPDKFTIVPFWCTRDLDISETRMYAVRSFWIET